MADLEKVKVFVEERLQGGDLFLVDLRTDHSGQLEVTLDSDTRVAIDDCVELSRAIEAAFGADDDDFALTVSSAGIGQPLRMLRQYKKLIGRPVEVLLKNGTKFTATLTGADENSITVSYSKMEAVEGKKKKQEVVVTGKYDLADVKSTVEHLDFN